MYEYRCKLDKIVDGDTVDVTVDLGFETYRKMRIRFSGIDTPEEGEQGYADAINYVRNWFDLTQNCIVRTEKAPKKETDKKDSFGRYLGTFYDNGPWEDSLNDRLLKAELATRYVK